MGYTSPYTNRILGVAVGIIVAIDSVRSRKLNQIPDAVEEGKKSKNSAVDINSRSPCVATHRFFSSGSYNLCACLFVPPVFIDGQSGQ